MLQSKGVSDLLQAEKKAQDLIEEARKRKNKRIKDAKDEAKADIEYFKNDRDSQYKKLEEKTLGDRSTIEADIKQDTGKKIADLRSQYDQNKKELLERVIALVCDIKPECHVNARDFVKQNQ
ncbi:unnamed protein product [Didymodactylos carnosus]|uniref:V-type proton ATPase subunit G n=1 Tax=Didymodactylos carnosus TaxID=1234261 RepID=A0A814E9U2_9BILA|nr:unnamed protein product [Didymodactylos carnosus]CAF0966532.1 unnamed protein product [Didymodactylos carnosus]CAF3587178.1 unnamed protein product [Didymodactylos carnosus]CAF3740041.1 unnamed protein product [Didymodactylos carnosus]